MAIGNPITLTSNVASKTINVIATASQSLFTVNGGYRINEIAVFRNGVRLVDGRDFTARDGSTVTLLSAATEGDALEFQIFDTFRVADAITPFDSDQTIAGNLNITGILSASQLGSVNFNVTSGIQTFNDVRVGGALTVAGVLTFDDVTNVDSVGFATFRSGINVQGAGSTTTTLNVTGVSTFGSIAAPTLTGDVSIADKIIHTGDTNTAIRFPQADTFSVETGGTEAYRVDSSRRILLGHTSSRAIGHASGDGKLQIEGTNLGTSELSIVRNSDNNGAAHLFIGKSRGSSVGDSTVVQNNDSLGIIGFVGADGTDLQTRAAQIAAVVDGAPGSNDMPGALLFSTTADGANSPTERLRIDSSGNMGLNATPEDWESGQFFAFQFGKGGAVFGRAAGDEDRNGFVSNCYHDSAGWKYIASSAHATKYDQNDGNHIWSTAGTGSADASITFSESARIDTSGRLLIGATAARTDFATTPHVQLEGDDFSTSSLSITRNDNGNGRPTLFFGKSRGTTNGATTVVQDDDGLGTIEFAGADGDQLHRAALIAAQVDATPGNNDMPGRLTFSTTADGATSPTERMRIDRQGRVGINDTTPDARLDIGGDDADIRLGGSQYFRIKALSTGELTFNDNDTNERLRIDSSGRLLVGKQTHSGDALFVVETEHASGGIIGEFDNNNSGNFGGMRVLGGVTDRECRLQALYGNSFFTFYTEGTGAAAERVRIKDSGSVLIGQTNESFGTVGHIFNASGQHYIIASGDTPLLINRQSNDGELIRLAQDGSTEGSVTVSGGTVTYGQFLGSHWGRLEDDSKPEILAGTILETVNKLVEWKVVEFTVDGVQKRQAYNGSAEVGDSATVTYEGTSYSGTIANEQESLPRNKHVCVKVSDTAASKAVFGVFLGWDETPEEDIIGTWNDMNIGAIGNYFIRIKSGQSLEIGDLIESDGSGCGVVQSDDSIRSKTVAKVTSTIPQTVYSDGSFLVTCVLYSG